MNSKKKIDILSPEEMRQETIGASGTEHVAGGCAITRVCPDGSTVECSGTYCEDRYKTVGGKRVLDSVVCRDQYGFTDEIFCSGASGTATNPEDACSGHAFGDHCEWQDETALMHYGVCQYDYNKPKLTLICNEAGSGSKLS